MFVYDGIWEFSSGLTAKQNSFTTAKSIASVLMLTDSLPENTDSGSQTIEFILKATLAVVHITMSPCCDVIQSCPHSAHWKQPISI